MTGRFLVSLLSALTWSKLATAVPADPSITAAPLLPRQNNDRFIGWVETSGSWTTEMCNVGLTWYQDGKYAQCCPTTLASCYAPTACVDGYMIYPYSDLSTTSTIACTDNYNNPLASICNTAFIYENFGDSNPRTDIVCGTASVGWSYYRKIPASATETSSSSEESSTSPGLISSGSTTASRPTISPLPPKEEKKSSKAWIAGVVVGPLLGLAIIGAIIFFLVRRKKQNNIQPQHGAAVVLPGGAPGGAPSGVQQYTEAKPQFAPQTGYAQPSPGYNPHDPYNQNQYGQQPMSPVSPAPQYAAPYSPAVSPPPQGHYAPVGPEKQTFQHVDQGQSHPNAAELGGASNPISSAHTPELSGDGIHRQS